MEEKLTDDELEGYNVKHKRIRGSSRLKYPPNESRCLQRCGIEAHDTWTHRFTGKVFSTEHRCFLSLGHEGPCEFSSECGVFLSPEVASEAAA
jgi:hypothetical protein